MSRPVFYAGTSPEAWLRTPRNAHTPAEIACAIERPLQKTSSMLAAMFRGLAILAAVVIVIHLIARAA